MILESAILDMKPGEAAAFELALREARPLVAICRWFEDIADNERRAGSHHRAAKYGIASWAVSESVELLRNCSA
jgi:hypothetical protein